MLMASFSLLSVAHTACFGIHQCHSAVKGPDAVGLTEIKDMPSANVYTHYHSKQWESSRSSFLFLSSFLSFLPLPFFLSPSPPLCLFFLSQKSWRQQLGVCIGDKSRACVFSAQHRYNPWADTASMAQKCTQPFNKYSFPSFSKSQANYFLLNCHLLILGSSLTGRLPTGRFSTCTFMYNTLEKCFWLLSSIPLVCEDREWNLRITHCPGSAHALCHWH